MKSFEQFHKQGEHDPSYIRKAKRLVRWQRFWRPFERSVNNHSLTQTIGIMFALGLLLTNNPPRGAGTLAVAVFVIGWLFVGFTLINIAEGWLKYWFDGAGYWGDVHDVYHMLTETKCKEVVGGSSKSKLPPEIESLLASASSKNADVVELSVKKGEDAEKKVDEALSKIKKQMLDSIEEEDKNGKNT